ILTLLQASVEHGYLLCSTPFGIIGILTAQTSPPTRQPSVLNAFRHHRNSHSDMTFGPGPAPPVLNAFRHHRNSHIGNERRRLVSKGVLNAFRHHRNSHTGPSAE